MNRSKDMKYWEKYLVVDEEPLHAFGVSRWYIVFVWILPATALLAIAINVMAWFNYLMGWMFLLLAVSLLVPALVETFFIHYAITSKRVMSRVGFLHKSFLTVDLRAVTDVEVFETWWERVFTKTGLVGVNTAGSDEVELKLLHVARPNEIKKDIYRHQNKLLKNAGNDHKVQGQPQLENKIN